ncbi:hypothetical protein Nepgr_002596 [Nepenthes gracilis]|uniref:Uncharacterized protein n=1 Tax=Nepenthes gracilis TaxID=150966 RepID=A0AAD3PA56_NEPGR|nr:hypothetical protein Nepgr_002596 [Nepenthes gracilis]
MSSSSVEEEVVYHWKTNCSLLDCNSNQSCSVQEARGLKVEQNVSPLPLEPGRIGFGCGTSLLSPLASVQIDFGLKLRPDSDLPSSLSSGPNGSAVGFEEESTALRDLAIFFFFLVKNEIAAKPSNAEQNSMRKHAQPSNRILSNRAP